MTISKHDHKQFYDGYIACAYWADEDTIDTSYPEGEFRLQAQLDCATFIKANADSLIEFAMCGYTMEQAGHDFWLTRQRHGVGFNDRKLGILGEQLTKSAQLFKEL